MLVFRADGNGDLGAGHVMRCLSLAAAAREQGQSCHFVLADADMAGLVARRGFACTVLHSDYRAMEQERPLLEPVLRQLAPQCLVVDSYFVTAAYLQWLRGFGTLAYLDDLAAFACPADKLINYNLYGPDMDYASLYRAAGLPAPEMYLGVGYAPLREEFRHLPERPFPETVTDILISTGGADLEHIALALVRRLLRRETLPGCRFHLVLGAMNADRPEIRALAGQAPQICLHENVQQMAELMCACQAAISAAGSTLYELCACGVPAVTYVLADNQLTAASTFAAKGLMLYAGDYRTDGPQTLEKMLQAVALLVQDSARRRRMAARMRAVVDGQGAARLARALTQ